jgi:hypothetical protein
MVVPLTKKEKKLKPNDSFTKSGLEDLLEKLENSPTDIKEEYFKNLDEKSGLSLAEKALYEKVLKEKRGIEAIKKLLYALGKKDENSIKPIEKIKEPVM